MGERSRGNHGLSPPTEVQHGGRQTGDFNGGCQLCTGERGMQKDISSGATLLGGPTAHVVSFEKPVPSEGGESLPAAAMTAFFHDQDDDKHRCGRTDTDNRNQNGGDRVALLHGKADAAAFRPEHQVAPVNF